MLPSRYVIEVTGPVTSRATLMGNLVLSSIDRVTTILHSADKEAIRFKYRGDARFVLRKAGRLIFGKNPKNGDELAFDGALARVVKVAS